MRPLLLLLVVMAVVTPKVVVLVVLEVAQVGMAIPGVPALLGKETQEVILLEL